MNNEDLQEILTDNESLVADGFETALIGYVERCSQPLLALYDRTKCLNILQERDGMTLEEAEEFFEFNVIGAWVGNKTPAFATLLEKESK